MKVILEHIDKSFRDGKQERKILSDFELTVESGQFVMLIGPSGCGKSTLLSIIGGLLTPDSGKVWMNGVDYFSLSDKRRAEFRRNNIGYIFQEFFLVDDLSPIDNILLTGNDSVNAIEVLKKVGLEGREKSKISTLSGGEKQRLAIARALAMKCNLLLCDEPTGSLDEDNTIQIMKKLKQISHDGTTVVMVTHNRELLEYADAVVDLRG